MVELSEPLENYLKEIYEIESINGTAKVTDLIIAFQVSPGTISKALERLESLGLIDRKNKRLRLTDDGLRIAERLVRSHRLSERLLTDILGIDWIRAHEIAHRLEHIWPDDILQRIDEVLGFPKTCPHGHPIPGRLEIHGELLSKAKLGKYKIIMIIKEEEWILRKAEEFGLFPGKELTLKNSSNNEILIEVNGKDESIPIMVAEQVMVDGT
ncbi:DtxR family transcriptional regulator [Candidatus Acidianus copahuensis]|uniref:DtxR family transcriptional regulator n=1 Tax=Candidatus Acidianus copahuensis TaxID=1160895 RepID=A0A031LMT5_9CREN|nr:metal-dependent transcriptional regulator [Candidatus Acidianus copahuensis]EZQ03205.1 DtxR family transcriptional regulator [Candidatus Acidianus copahuensis]